MTDETGSGSLVFGTSPTITSATLVTPALGTPASGTLTNCSGTAASLTAGAAQQLTTTNFTVSQSGSSLVFKYGTTVVAKLSSTGVFTALNDVVADDTLT
jgi:hypothetical protein